MRLNQVILIASITMTVALSSACKEHVPASGTEAYNRQHGIVNDGKTVNEITLINDRNSSRPKLRFPSQIAVGVETSGTLDANPKPIRKGFAHVAYVGLEFNEEKRLVPIVKKPDHLIYESVYLRYRSSLGPTNQTTAKRLQEIAHLSGQALDRQDLGLREYQLIGSGQGHSIYYIPLDESFKLPGGENLLIQCDGPQSKNGHIGTCGTSFSHVSGASVSYRFRSEILPYWRELHGQVYKFTDSIIVRN